MSQLPPPPPFPSRFAGPPQPHRFPPSTEIPPPGHFHGGPPPPPSPQPFLPPPPPPPPPAFPPFSGGGLCPSAFSTPPPLRPPFPPPPPWPQQPPPPERPSFPWRPEAPPWQDGERPRPGPPLLRPEAAEAATPATDSIAGGGEEWLRRFLAPRRRPVAESSASSSPHHFGPSQAGRLASEALRLVAQVSVLCRAWRRRGDEAEAGEVAEAEAKLAELREVVRPLREAEGESAEGPPPGSPLALLRRRLERSRQKRRRRQRRREEARQAREEAAARVAEREAQIERWRARRAQEVEDRHREKELKAAADSVLSEVRKKQADTKRMAEILRGLEKLRKLRKEAAGRKGVCPAATADEAFENEVQSLRALIKKRTELYEAEERALRVMLEGEQEEERKRDMERKQRKEREKLLQQKREMDSKLFGNPDEFPLTHILEPFTQYYLQAEYSVPALIQIRHEWDRYLVPEDHPEGHCIPPGWVLPSPPSNDIWATAVR